MEKKEKNNINNNENDNLIDKIFFKKYRCIQKIGQGSFGFVYKAEYDNKYYALKFENNSNGKNILEHESSIMLYLKGPNIPYIKTYGTSGAFNILVMQLLGKNLQSLLIEMGGTFSIKTVCILAYQMISILEHIHNKNIIHRDIKPENFLMGLDNNSKFLYLSDFGLSKSYNQNSTTHYTPNKEGKKLTGTPRYASINAMRGLEQSPRDDLESIGYILVYLLKGELPWQNIIAKNKTEKFKKLLVKKIEISSSDLCLGLPNKIEKYIDYCKDLEFEDIPDYQMLKNFFIEILQQNKQEFDYIYDWSKSDVGEKLRNVGYNNNNVSVAKNKNYYNITQERTIIITNKENNEIKGVNNNDLKEKIEEKEKKENKENELNKQEICCCEIY